MLSVSAAHAAECIISELAMDADILLVVNAGYDLSADSGERVE
jgi:hypothetical protein